MSLKRALVVDDSKVARIALKKQLEEYDITVELADCAEEALDFLTGQTVDVVFMDHVMPGMNGLEAVKAIKSNPATAMIPVMMYTSKAGEVYVSQARALGAVDLLPKEVEPGVLFGMLMKLGLVSDRRDMPREQEFGESPDETTGPHDTDIEEQPSGIALPELLARIIEDQHSVLRSDMLSSHRSFAKQVAHEVHELQRADRVHAVAGPRIPSQVLPMLTGALAVATLSLLFALLQARGERDDARDSLADLTTASTSDRLSAIALQEELNSAISEQRARSEATTRSMFDAIIWALNESGTVAFGGFHWNDGRAEQTSGLLRRLSSTGFRGTVLAESHLGEFCLAIDDAGDYQLAEPDVPVSSCAYIGHPLDNSNLPGDRQSRTFQEFVAGSPLLEGTGIKLELVDRLRVDSVPLVPYPIEPMLAGEWNRIAAQNNRVEFSLLSDDRPEAR